MASLSGIFPALAARPDPRQTDPLIGFSPAWRLTLIAYFVVWKILPGLLSPVIHGSANPYVLLSMMVNFALGLCTIAPLLMPRIAGIPSGWLHPLLLPLLVSELKSMLKNPENLLTPLSIWFQPLPDSVDHELLTGWSPQAVFAALLKVDSLNLLAAVSVLGGFVVFRWRASRYETSRPSNLTSKMVLLFGAVYAAFALFLYWQGGLVSYLQSFASGRYVAKIELGYILGVFAASPALLTIWYSADHTVERKPLFWFAVVMTCAMQFASTGSRSGTVYPLISLALVYLWHHRRPPVAMALVTAFLGLLAVGVLGQIRSSVWQSSDTGGELSFEAITHFDLEAALTASREQIDARDASSPILPTIAMVPEQTGYLWGESYLGAILFFIPRAIWEEKPRGIGAYSQNIIFGKDIYVEGPYTGNGASPGDVAEAYWNFDLFGVVVVFALYGGLLSWATRTYMLNPDSFAVFSLYLALLTSFSGPGSSDFAPFMQRVCLMFALFWSLGVFRRRQRWP